jgi:hypothetical protein
LNNVVQNEPIRERDKSMYGMIQAIGTEKGKPFKPTKEWNAIYKDGAQCTFEYLQETFVTPGEGLIPFYGGDSE